MHLFYCPDIEANPVMTEIESQHAVKVLRLGTGDEIKITDGKGSLFICKIKKADKKHCETEIIEKICEEKINQNHLHIFIAPTKRNDRFEWFIEKAVELGVDEITPIVCNHSDRKKLNHERVCKVAISAMKQSLRTTLPSINTLTKFDAAVMGCKSDLKLIAYCGKKTRFINDLEINNKSTAVFIGPEGDFSEEEITLAEKHHFKSVSLGKNRLRTETAALFCCINHVLVNQYHEQ